jgi:putative endonuclease
MKQPCVYIVANKRHGTLYTGVTSNLPKRAFEHREGLVEGFSAKYGCKILVWYELHETMIEAITREKQVKAGSRAKKIALIEGLGPVDSKDSLLSANQIQGFFWGGGLGCDGSFGFERRGLGADGAADYRPA